MSYCGCGGSGYDSDYGYEKGWESDVIKVSYNKEKAALTLRGIGFLYVIMSYYKQKMNQ
ncbi:hypothetical protein BTS2_1675 [Bacillus sp. TS-2]|nr:hypothetical protein BTS2_1675 [Bacillus sp. TS-2]